MVETLKVNLDRTYLVLRIAGIVGGALIACGLAYGQIDARQDKLEIRQAVSEAIAETKLDSMNSKIDLIYDIVKAKQPNKK